MSIATRTPTALYQIDLRLWDLAQQREEAEAAGDAEAVARIDRETESAVAELSRKVDAIAHTRREYLKRSEAAREEAERILEHAKRWERRAETLSRIVAAVMQSRGDKAWETATDKVTRCANGGVQRLTFYDAVPDEYQNITLTMTVPEWMDIMEAACDGASIETVRRIHKISNSGAITANTEMIREALKTQVPCPDCSATDWRDKAKNLLDGRPCPRCQGKGTVQKTVPGARLAPRGEHLEWK